MRGESPARTQASLALHVDEPSRTPRQAERPDDGRATYLTITRCGAVPSVTAWVCVWPALSLTSTR